MSVFVLAAERAPGGHGYTREHGSPCVTAGLAGTTNSLTAPLQVRVNLEVGD